MLKRIPNYHNCSTTYVPYKKKPIVIANLMDMYAVMAPLKLQPLTDFPTTTNIHHHNSRLF